MQPSLTTVRPEGPHHRLAKACWLALMGLVLTLINIRPSLAADETQRASQSVSQDCVLATVGGSPVFASDAAELAQLVSPPPSRPQTLAIEAALVTFAEDAHIVPYSMTALIDQLRNAEAWFRRGDRSTSAVAAWQRMHTRAANIEVELHACFDEARPSWLPMD